MKISAQFATSLDSPEHIAVAERLGYARAWLFDTPQQNPDVWMMLALAAEHTERIGLGPGVLVPALRHPMVNAAGAAALEALAPGRTAVAFGTDSTGARAMGAKPSTWSYMSNYIDAFRRLLRGKTVEWDGGRMRMLHPTGHAAPRSVEVPVLISALGPKGLAVTRELTDGLFTVNGETASAREFTWAALGVHGAVLADGEALDSPRVQAAAGPGNALAFHFAYEAGADVAALPDGQAWLAVIQRVPERDRHLAVHDQHLVTLNAADEAAWAAGSWTAIPTTTVTGSARQLRQRLSAFAEDGITEIVYQPTGPDIAGELEAFIKAANKLTTGGRRHDDS
ncbi:LLM class flavin-dependent oxidoreductase [Planosporangium sp. 12N6]|uniref:LLM class flavin-dependent oxidoreductase n=1 Tax=Planosporangium spinosum TaxID=3402278 RepID=UPI003CE98189